MKTRLLIPFILLAATILACETNVKTSLVDGKSKGSKTEVLKLAVNPPSGYEDFSLEVTYQVTCVKGSEIPAIQCIWDKVGGIPQVR